MSSTESAEDSSPEDFEWNLSEDKHQLEELDDMCSSEYKPLLEELDMCSSEYKPQLEELDMCSSEYKPQLEELEVSQAQYVALPQFEPLPLYELLPDVLDEIRSKITKRTCFVPQCPNNGRNSKKLFFRCPPGKKKIWLKKARRVDKLSETSSMDACEDHFDIENDIYNYMKVRLGFLEKVRLKPNAYPRFFNCQKNRTLTHKKPERSAVVIRKRKAIINEIEEQEKRNTILNEIEEQEKRKTIINDIEEQDKRKVIINEIEEQEKRKAIRNEIEEQEKTKTIINEIEEQDKRKVINEIEEQEKRKTITNEIEEQDKRKAIRNEIEEYIKRKKSEVLIKMSKIIKKQKPIKMKEEHIKIQENVNSILNEPWFKNISNELDS